MATNHEALRDLDISSSTPLAVEGVGKKTHERRTGLSVTRIGWRELSRLELPLTVVLGLFFTITLIMTPGLEVSPLGLDLPVLIFCPLLLITGIPCLMCGITRSFLAMGGFDVSGAFVFHPLGPVLYMFLVLLLAISVYSLVARKRVRLTVNRRQRSLLIRTGTIVIMAAWVLKVVIWNQTGLL